MAGGQGADRRLGGEDAAEQGGMDALDAGGVEKAGGIAEERPARENEMGQCLPAALGHRPGAEARRSPPASREERTGWVLKRWNSSNGSS